MEATLTSKLKEEAKKNEAFRAVCTVFAVRARARQKVTLTSLSRVMHREGFQFSADDYKAVLARFADLGIGKLDRDPKNRLRALKDISIRLQSIGKAAVDGNVALTPFKPAVRFKDLPAMVETPPKPVVKGVRKQMAPGVIKSIPVVTISITVGGECVKFEVPVNGLKLSK